MLAARDAAIIEDFSCKGVQSPGMTVTTFFSPTHPLRSELLANAAIVTCPKLHLMRIDESYACAVKPTVADITIYHQRSFDGGSTADAQSIFSRAQWPRRFGSTIAGCRDVYGVLKRVRTSELQSGQQRTEELHGQRCVCAVGSRRRGRRRRRRASRTQALNEHDNCSLKQQLRDGPFREIAELQKVIEKATQDEAGVTFIIDRGGAHLTGQTAEQAAEVEIRKAHNVRVALGVAALCWQWCSWRGADFHNLYSNSLGLGLALALGACPAACCRGQIAVSAISWARRCSLSTCLNGNGGHRACAAETSCDHLIFTRIASGGLKQEA